MQSITYEINKTVTLDDFISVLEASELSQRRPMSDKECLQGMLDNSNLIVTAKDKDKVVGIARSITDLHCVCYISDIAVDKQYQKLGIGKKLQQITKEQLHHGCQIILLAAPKAKFYYEHIGYTHNPRCWVLAPEDSISS